MPDPVEMILQLVAAGRITPDEASQLLAALDETDARQAASDHLGRDATRRVSDADTPGPDGATSSRPDSAGDGAARARDEAGRTVRIEVTEDGQVVVNLRLPATLGDLAMRRVPGLSEDQAARIRDALHRGRIGDILRVTDDGGNGVRISLE